MSQPLQEFDLITLLAILHLGDEVYGVPLCRELAKLLNRDVATASVYKTLEQLEHRGLVVSTLGAATPQRGGRAKRYFRVTKDGLQAIHNTRELLTELWRDVPVMARGTA